MFEYFFHYDYGRLFLDCIINKFVTTCCSLIELFWVHVRSHQARKVLHMAKHDRIDFSLRTDREAQERRVTFAKTHHNSRKLGRN